MYNIQQPKTPRNFPTIAPPHMRGNHFDDSQCVPSCTSGINTVGQSTPPAAAPQNQGWSDFTYILIGAGLLGAGIIGYNWYRSAGRKRLERVTAVNQAVDLLECNAKAKGIEVVKKDSGRNPSITVRLKNPVDIYQIPSNMEINGYNIEILLEEKQQKALETLSSK